MSNNREKNLWQEIDKMIFFMSILGVIILCGGYYIVYNSENISLVWRELIISVITNILPTFLLFIGAYIVFRRLEKLRSERDADEIANIVILKFFQVLEEIQANNQDTNNSNTYDPYLPLSEDFHIPTDMKLRLELDVKVQMFDVKANPQKVVVECKYRGGDPIYIKKITYHGTNLKAKEHLSDIYKLDGFNAIISEEPVKVSSLEPYTFELILAKIKRWKKIEIESWYENLGFLYFDIEYENQRVNISKKI